LHHLLRRSSLLQNSAVVYGGGVLAQYGQYNATATRHAGNTAQWGGGGAISLFSAVALLRSCELSGNHAGFGGAINAMRMKESDIVVPTIVSINVGGGLLSLVLAGCLHRSNLQTDVWQLQRGHVVASTSASAGLPSRQPKPATLLMTCHVGS
jgi:hypothetical protein